MKRVSILAAALIACMAIAVAPATAAKKKKVKVKIFPTTTSLAVTTVPADTPYSPGSGTSAGQVAAGGPAACREGRAVTITYNGAFFTGTVSGVNGIYSTNVNATPPPGTYQASVNQVKIVKKKVNKKTGKKKKKKTICTASTSPPVIVP
jgi:hypothetical protein